MKCLATVRKQCHLPDHPERAAQSTDDVTIANITLLSVLHQPTFWQQDFRRTIEVSLNCFRDSLYTKHPQELWILFPLAKYKL